MIGWYGRRDRIYESIESEKAFNKWHDSLSKEEQDRFDAASKEYHKYSFIASILSIVVVMIVAMGVSVIYFNGFK